MISIINREPCVGCLDYGMQMQDSGVLKGMVRPCLECAGTLKGYQNRYGTDSEEHPELYIDTDSGIIGRIKDKQKGGFKLANGQEVEFEHEVDPFEEVNKNNN